MNCRYRTCALKRLCKNMVLLEEKKCKPPGSECEILHGRSRPDTDVAITENSKEPLY